MRLLILSLLIAVLLPTTAMAQDAFNGLSIDVQSDLCVTAAEAVEQSDWRLRRLLEQELARRTPLSTTVLAPSIPHLMFSADAQRTQRTESVQRPYGTLYRRHEQLRLPEQLVRDWLSKIEATEHSRVRHQWLMAAGVV